MKLSSEVSWKIYFLTGIDTLLGFCISTFSLGMYVTHGGIHYSLGLIVMILLYVFVMYLFIKRIVEKFSLAALMLLIPIAPLIVLILIVSLIPLLHFLK